ncbi:olfactory receptor 8D1-like [Ambystoma mexicanum]|uniref:olfactory receptor 8D1-like n=1 Tax=Ambystoma mexicanum TaxID=8296 RepID=UPI0037E875F3
MVTVSVVDLGQRESPIFAARSWSMCGSSSEDAVLAGAVLEMAAAMFQVISCLEDAERLLEGLNGHEPTASLTQVAASRRESESSLRCWMFGTLEQMTGAGSLTELVFRNKGMTASNHTTIGEFVILGLTELQVLQIPLFLLFFLIYIMVLLGNLTIIFLVCVEPRLHSPMYFFLINLSLLEISAISVTIPKMEEMLLTQRRVISFAACIFQLYLFLCFTDVELYLLAAMAYDRYVAICNPLRYSLVMNRAVCLALAAFSWMLGFMSPLAHTILISLASFCGSTEINHFFCDITALMTLACSDTAFIELFSYLMGAVFGVGPFALTITSYVFIITTIVRIPSSAGRRKAFFTCSSHLMVVILFYGTCISVYMRPASSFSMKENKLATVLYVTVVPLLNPLIYSLRNQEVKQAIRKVVETL